MKAPGANDREGMGTSKEWLHLANLMENIPISFIVDHSMTYNKDKKPIIDLDADTGFETFTAGAFRDVAGFWAEYSFTDKEVGEAYIQFRHPFNLPLNLKVGRFQPKLSLWKSNNHPGINDLTYNAMSVGDNAFAIGSEQGGIELNSVITPYLFAATGITNSPNSNNRNGKDWYGHISVRVGGTDFLGNEPDIDLDHDSIWDNLSLTFGGFGYVGASDAATSTVNSTATVTDINGNPVTVTTQSDVQTVPQNDYYRAGLEAEALYKRLRVKLGAVYGKDNHPNIGSTAAEKSLYFLAQGEYLLGSNVLVTMRYEHQDVENDHITRIYAPTVAWTPWQNIRLALEYDQVRTTSVNGDASTDREGIAQVSFSY